MAGPSAVELARTAQQDIAVLRAEFEAFAGNTDAPEMSKLRERFATVEEKVTHLENVVVGVRQVPVIDDRVAKLEVRVAEADSLREQVAVLKAEIKKAKDQTDSRIWNVLMIAVGAVLSLLGGVVVQLIAFTIKK